MQSNDHDLQEAFAAAYADFCSGIYVEPDPTVLAALWAEFLFDALQGFPSLFDHDRS